MYTETQQSIRNSLWNFMGSILNASMFEENSKKKENVTALISEELCKFSKTEDEKIDMQAAKPILKSAIWVLEARRLELSSIPLKTDAINKTVDELDTLIASLKAYVDRI